jgi:hypothetical protein
MGPRPAFVVERLTAAQNAVKAYRELRGGAPHGDDPEAHVMWLDPGTKRQS